MPPRYAYWTILVDHQPTAFRAGAQEDLMPTFKRLKEKHPSAVMMWFQNGKLWNSRLDAQEAMRARGEMGRRGDDRQGGFRDRDRRLARASTHAPKAPRTEKLDWKPKGAFTPEPTRAERPERKPRLATPQASEWKAKPAHTLSRTGKPEWKPRDKHARGGSGSPVDRTKRRERLEWKPKGAPAAPRSPESGPAKRKWIPKEEYKKSKGIEVPRDSKWRPGGVHRDPRQKYKDAKKAKWGSFKKTIRSHWESKTKKKGDD